MKACASCTLFTLFFFALILNPMAFYRSSFKRIASVVVRPRCMRLSDATNSLQTNGSSDHTSLNAKAIRIEVERIHKKTFNGIVKLNDKIIAGDKSMNSSDTIEIQRKNLTSLRERLLSATKLLDLVANKSAITDQVTIDACLETLRNLGVEASRVQVGAASSTKNKPKNVPASPRLPYVSYISSDDIIIRVGRSASDNDELSCSRAYRDDADWWLHVHGFSGSHVVIRSNDDELPIKFPSTLREAATLAAMQSKCPESRTKCEVTYTRCRHVTKERTDPPGLVRLDSSRTGIIIVNRRSTNLNFEKTLKSKSFSEAAFNIQKS